MCKDLFQVTTNSNESDIEKRLSFAAEEFVCSGALTKQARSF